VYYVKYGNYVANLEISDTVIRLYRTMRVDRPCRQYEVICTITEASTDIGNRRGGVAPRIAVSQAAGSAPPRGADPALCMCPTSDPAGEPFCVQVDVDPEERRHFDSGGTSRLS